MKYKIKVVKNDNETFYDTLHITDAIPSVMNGKLPKYIMPLNSTFFGGCLAFSDKIDKINDNVNPFIFNKIGGGVYNNGVYQITGIEGNIKSLCFSYKDAVEHYEDSKYMTDGSIGLGYDTAQNVSFIDYENSLLYTYSDINWTASDMILRRYKMPTPEVTLQNGKWSYDYISYVNINQICELEEIKTVPHVYFSDNYNASGINFAELDGYDAGLYSSKAKSVVYYGKFNSHSITQNKNYIFGMCFFAYDDVLTSTSEVVESHSFFEFCIIDKKTWEVIPFYLDNVGSSTQYRLGCADDDYIYIIDGENTPKYMYKLSIAELLEFAANNEKQVDKLGCERYIKNANLQAFQPYESYFCHTISVRNLISNTSLNGYDSEAINLQVYKGTNGFTGIFKQAIAGITNFNINVVSSDVLKIYIEEAEE